ncbi:MAG: hypothetical protein ACI9P8_001538, partial [Bacteroidia bacterium]
RLQLQLEPVTVSSEVFWSRCSTRGILIFRGTPELALNCQR